MWAPTIIEPQAHVWTHDEYVRAGDAGLFRHRRVQLIEGEIIDMPPLGNLHCISTECSARVLRTAFGHGFWMRVQMPLDLSPLSDPEPDISVVQGLPRDYLAHPKSALLVVEVSDSTLHFDQREKASLYAKAGIADYWIVNLVDRQLEVHRNPQADPRQAFGFGYADLVILDAKASATPLAAPQARILVADLLP